MKNENEERKWWKAWKWWNMKIMKKEDDDMI